MNTIRDLNLETNLKAMDYDFKEIDGERFVCINDLESMPSFFVSMVSSQNHWLFTSTNGALSAGRSSPEHALFPYYTVDKIIDNSNCTGPQTIIRVGDKIWEPFKISSERIFAVSRKIYKSINGDTLIFEEHNTDLNLNFSFRWSTSDKYGFVRNSKLVNTGESEIETLVIDGLADFLASGVDDRTQSAYSCLTDAYKVSELNTSKKLLIHRMVASLVDEAIPLECLRATTIWAYGWEESKILIEQSDVESFIRSPINRNKDFARGKRGCFYKAGSFKLKAGSSKSWALVADIDRNQSEVAELTLLLSDADSVWNAVQIDIKNGRDRLEELVQSSDGLQACSQEIVSTYHRANVLFNIMRGGVFSDNYQISKRLLINSIKTHNKSLSKESLDLVNGLGDTFTYNELLKTCEISTDYDLRRICREYLPLVFSRRHGDPSRPWNRFKIQTKDTLGNPIFGFQGNWRDIFQNWEALAWSFPYYNDAFIFKFLNASTADGYNPYRITDSGVEWEQPDPNDPWASIGYWGDHQIIYLLKLLEFSESFKKKSLNKLLEEDLFVFADVPYEIKDFDLLKEDPNHSIYYNEERNSLILDRFDRIGADGKLVHDSNSRLVRANLFEKILIPFLVKLSNYVPNGGIWMNTQRPEWNDANNALAGFGLSMVTTYYMYRYLGFLENLINEVEDTLPCFEIIQELIEKMAKVFVQDPKALNENNNHRFFAIEGLGRAGEQYRKLVYEGKFGKKSNFKITNLKSFLKDVRNHLKNSINSNLRTDGLYNAYNILNLNIEESTASVDYLGPMLEGQVAVLSSQSIGLEESLELLESLRNSPLYCKDRKSYILYEDKRLPSFLDYNRVTTKSALSLPLLVEMIENEDKRIIEKSFDGCFRFNAEIRNRFELKKVLEQLRESGGFGALIDQDEDKLFALYESTFNHKAFTGRSGSMFAYEGLGSIYWHMVSKLMLAVQELALESAYNGARDFESLVSAYYDIQEGLGFRKKASEYGAFTADAYSHTPSFAGAQQPGLTGMVKEGIICRFGELGVSFENERLRFKPKLIRIEELCDAPKSVRCLYPNQSVETIEIPKGSMLFTITQIPIIYQLIEGKFPEIRVEFKDGNSEIIKGDTLSHSISKDLFSRTSNVLAIYVSQPRFNFL